MRANQLVYLIGPPGSGKSTLMAALTTRCERHDRVDNIPHQALVNRQTGEVVAAELGVRRPSFPGTDAMSMSIGPSVCLWMAEQPYALVLGEGDRLAYPVFLNSSRAAGYEVTLVYVECEAETLYKRCLGRGSKQDISWRQGRATKARNLAEQAIRDGHNVVYVDTTSRPADMLALELRADVAPLWRLP